MGFRWTPSPRCGSSTPTSTSATAHESADDDRGPDRSVRVGDGLRGPGWRHYDLHGWGGDYLPSPETTTSTAAETTTTATETAGHEHESGAGTLEVTPEIAANLAQIRAGTAPYTNSLDPALDDGFFIITQMIPDMGYHFLNPNVEGFDIARPPILVYGRDGDDWVLGAVEWVFPEQPAEPPMEGGTYGAFPAACHYDDGLFVPTATEEECAETHSDTGAGFTFWHPDLVTFHVWAWMHNPDGLYNGTNPLMSPFNEG